MSVLDNEYIIEANFRENLMKSQHEVIKDFLYGHMSHIIYKHFMGEIVVPNKYKYIPIMLSNGFKSSRNRRSMIDVIEKNYKYILKSRSKARSCGIHMHIKGNDSYITIVGEFLMLHSSIEFEGCEKVFVSSSNPRVKHCSIMVDGGGNRYTLIHE